MLEIERPNRESAETSAGTGQDSTGQGSQGRGLLRRARRAVSRPAGPPAAAADDSQGGSAGAAPAEAGGPAAVSFTAPSVSGETAGSGGTGSPGAPASAQAGNAAAAGEQAAPRRRRSSRPAGGQPQAAEASAPPPEAAPASPAPAGLAPGSPAPGSPASAGAAQPPPVSFQPPVVIFQPPDISAGRAAARRPAGPADSEGGDSDATAEAAREGDGEPGGSAGRRRRRGGRGKGRAAGNGEPGSDEAAGGAEGRAAGQPGSGEQGDGAGRGPGGESDEQADGGDADGSTAPARRRRRRRRTGSGDAEPVVEADDPPNTVVHVRAPRAAAAADVSDVRSVKGSTRLEAKRQRRREGRESGRRRPPIITESEFLARREAVERVMIVRQRGDRTQIAVLEDGILVEHYVDKASHQSYVGNVYLGKVQNVLPSMEAAFVDIGKGRNAVLYAGEVNFDASGLEGESKRIESALKSGQSILVQVTKDPIGHKGARLTSQVSLPGRYLVYVPGASMTGISRKLPDTERARLKQILKQVMPEHAGVIVRTAAEGASEEELARDVARLSAQWEAIERKAKTAAAPELLYSEPDLTIRVVRDIFNEDFTKLVVASDSEWDLVDEYVRYVAPHLADRLERWPGGGEPDGDEKDVFAAYRVDEQLAKALERKVWLPSGGSLVIDTTEAMTVIDVNTGKFTGQGGNLEQTVTRNNLEAAEEIVRQLRLRDVGGIIVIDFIDMVLESNRELVLRRLLECLARDRTKHQVAEVTSLGLVQMTRKRVGSGLLEAFSVPCEHCSGRGVVVSLEPVDHAPARGRGDDDSRRDGRGQQDRSRSGRGRQAARPGGHGRGAAGDEQGDAAAANGQARTDQADQADQAEAAGGRPGDGPARPGAQDAESVPAAAAGDELQAGNDGPDAGPGPAGTAPGGRRRRRGGQRSAAAPDSATAGSAEIAGTQMAGQPGLPGPGDQVSQSAPAGTARLAGASEPTGDAPPASSPEPAELTGSAEAASPIRATEQDGPARPATRRRRAQSRKQSGPAGDQSGSGQSGSGQSGPAGDQSGSGQSGSAGGAGEGQPAGLAQAAAEQPGS